MPRRASTTRNISPGWRASAENWKSWGAHQARVLPARRATEWLDALAETWQKTDLGRAASRLDAPAFELADRLEQQLRTDREQLTHVRGIKMRSVVVH